MSRRCATPRISTSARTEGAPLRGHSQESRSLASLEMTTGARDDTRRNGLMQARRGATLTLWVPRTGPAMDVSPNLQRKLQQTLGTEAAGDLLAWMQSMDAH